MDLVSIGKRIKAERQKNGLTQEALAERIEVSAHYVYELERGLKAMSVPILIRISEVLHTSTDYLLFGEAVFGISGVVHDVCTEFKYATRIITTADGFRNPNIFC